MWGVYDWGGGLSVFYQNGIEALIGLELSSWGGLPTWYINQHGEVTWDQGWSIRTNPTQEFYPNVTGIYTMHYYGRSINITIS